MSTDHRTATAERNADAILDAAEALLERGAPLTTTALAAEAGLSRVTVYTHFGNQEALLEGMARRIIERFEETFASLDLDGGSPPERLDELIAMAWNEQGRYERIASAVTSQLSSAALERAHGRLRAPIAALIRRGQEAGDFRTDLPVEWLVSSYFALMHACRQSVERGSLGAEEAVGALQATVHSILAVPSSDSLALAE
ncbi:MAG TPA: TetR/AcrR family transcriptional regulator [Solirubrobacterales bacterium]|jgi:AcrR family transcriptional regulator